MLSVQLKNQEKINHELTLLVSKQNDERLMVLREENTELLTQNDKLRTQLANLDPNRDEVYDERDDEIVFLRRRLAVISKYVSQIEEEITKTSSSGSRSPRKQPPQPPNSGKAFPGVKLRTETVLAKNAHALAIKNNN